MIVSPARSFHRLAPRRAASSARLVGSAATSRVGRLLLVAICLLFGHPLGADEPAEIFLKQLRAVGYYDTALQYLDRLDRYPGVPADLLDAVQLERAQTLLEAAGASRNVQRRDEYLVQAEQALQEFLTNKPSHPRASEARLQLGTLQMVRAAVLVKASKPGEEDRETARESYLAAAATFDQIVETLRDELESMKGQRINAADQPERAELRTRYRGQYMQGKLRGGEARRRAAETFEDPAQQGKKLLQEALERFTELSEKYDQYLPGALGMLQRGQVQEELGQHKAALDSYQRVLEQADSDLLRPSKMEAVSGLIRLWLQEDPPKAQAAIDRGQPWVDGARPNERREEPLQRLRLQLAKAYLAQEEINESNGGNPVERQKANSSARQLLIASSRVAGPHQDDAKQLLATMGIDAATETEPAETPKSLDEALTAARALVEQSDQLSLSLNLLRDQLQSAGTDKQAIQDEITAIKSEQVQIVREAIDLLQHGMAFVKRGVDPTQANEARQFLAYALFRADRFSEAAVVGNFIARTLPGSERGLQGGILALSSLQTQLQREPQNTHLLQRIESLGSYLVAQWPDAPQVAQTRGTLVRIALTENRWEDARRQIEETPDDSPEKAEFQRLMGQLVWNRYLTLKQENPADAAADALLSQAAGDLTAGLKGLKPADLKPGDLQAAMILAKIQLRQGKASQALQTLEHPRYGPLKFVDKVDGSDEDFTASLYGVALQAVVEQMTEQGSDSQALLKRSSALMDKLRESAGEGVDSQEQLVRKYQALAGNIRRRLDDAPPGKKSDLIKAFELFLARVSDQTNDPDTLQMVGQTLAEMGEAAMGNPDRAAQGQAADLLSTAASTLTNLVKLVKDQDKLLVLRYQLGRVHRLLGEYQAALDEFEKVLSVKPMTLEAQVEAATTYEQWAAVVKPKFAGKAYEFALRGARPDAKTGQNTIWGWGKISQLTSSKAAFRETFFDARYHVALCRFLQGKSNDNKGTMEQAIRDITQLAATYPGMGGDASRQKFDRLLRTMQKELSVPVTGLDDA